MSSPLIRARNHALALFALAHVAVMLLGSQPRPEFGQGPLATAVEARWRAVEQATHRARRTYGAWLGPKQGWAMFAGVRNRSGRIEIRAHIDGTWHTLYAERSDTATWRRRTFDHYRWREAFLYLTGDHGRRGGHWIRASDWLLDEVFTAFPEADHARIVRMRSRLLTPEELRAGKRKRFEEKVLVRGRPR